MLDIKFVQENRDFVMKKAASRGLEIDLDEFMKFSHEKKEYLKKVEDLRYEVNKTSKLIGQMKKERRTEYNDMSRISVHKEKRNTVSECQRFKVVQKAILLPLTPGRVAASIPPS